MERLALSHCTRTRAGHGGSVPDVSGDEEDGKDETMIPVDYKTAGQIKDDTIFEEARRTMIPTLHPDWARVTSLS